MVSRSVDYIKALPTWCAVVYTVHGPSARSYARPTTSYWAGEMRAGSKVCSMRPPREKKFPPLARLLAGLLLEKRISNVVYKPSSMVLQAKSRTRSIGRSRRAKE